MPFAASWGPVARPQVVLVMAPMYHTNGFATLFSLLAGDHLVVLQKFDAARIVDLIEAHGVTTFTATTLMLQRIADLPDIDDRDLSSLVWILQGAAVISAVARAPLDRPASAPSSVYQSYGMTEGIGLCAIRGDEWLQHPGSVGRGFREHRDPHPRPRRRRAAARRDRRDLHALTEQRHVPVPRRRAAAAAHGRRLLHRRRPRAGSSPRGSCTSSTGAST